MELKFQKRECPSMLSMLDGTRTLRVNLARGGIIYSQSNKFVTGVKVKATVTQNLMKPWILTIKQHNSWSVPHWTAPHQNNEGRNASITNNHGDTYNDRQPVNTITWRRPALYIAVEMSRSTSQWLNRETNGQLSYY